MADVHVPKRLSRACVDGVLLVDKPVGPSSQQVVGHLKRLFNAEKVGHGGTLDPLASGLLVIGLGEATKFLQRHLTGDKRYIASLNFGARTTTGDAEGEIVETSLNVPSAQILNAVLPQFLGEISQTPPIFSALKVDGKPAYARARAGESVELAPRKIRIEHISLRSFVGNVAEIEVACGPGTYIRTLGEDIAKASGSVGHLSALRRTAARNFQIENCVSIDVLGALDPTARFAKLHPVEALLSDLPRLQLTEDQFSQLSCGRTTPTDLALTSMIARAYHQGAFCGLVHVEGDRLRVERWLSSAAAK